MQPRHYSYRDRYAVVTISDVHLRLTSGFGLGHRRRSSLMRRGLSMRLRSFSNARLGDLRSRHMLTVVASPLSYEHHKRLSSRGMRIFLGGAIFVARINDFVTMELRPLGAHHDGTPRVDRSFTPKRLESVPRNDDRPRHLHVSRRDGPENRFLLTILPPHRKHAASPLRARQEKLDHK